ncbi:MAG: hypothetical protein U0793_32180 [Gemmataceae bacterium]
MFSHLKFLTLTLLTTTGLLLSERHVQAQTGNGYAMVVLRNPTGGKFNYSVRWGGGIWYNHSVEGNDSRSHWFRLNSSGAAPNLEVRFHTGQPGVYRTYTLSWNRVETTTTFDGAAYYTANYNDIGVWDVTRD